MACRRNGTSSGWTGMASACPPFVVARAPERRTNMRQPGIQRRGEERPPASCELLEYDRDLLDAQVVSDDASGDRLALHIRHRVHARPPTLAPRGGVRARHVPSEVVHGLRGEPSRELLVQEVLEVRRLELRHHHVRQGRAEEVLPYRTGVARGGWRVLLRGEPPFQEPTERRATPVRSERLQPLALAVRMTLQLELEPIRPALVLRPDGLLPEPARGRVSPLCDPAAPSLQVLALVGHRRSPPANVTPSG